MFRGMTLLVRGDRTGRGVGRAIAERLTERRHLIALDRDAEALDWTLSQSMIEASPATRPTSRGFAVRYADVPITW